MKKLGLTLLLIAFFCHSAVAAAPRLEMELQADGMYVSNISSAVLQRLYKDYGYADYIYMPEWKYPPIFLKKMPFDFNRLADEDLRNRLFLQIMAPLALAVNENLVLERAEIAAMYKQLRQKQALTEEQRRRLEGLAVQYDVFTRVKGAERYDILLKNLLLKVDAVPPSLLIAAAAAESNWGTAEEVAAGNALYKAKEWYTKEGIKPKGESDDSYRIKTYATLYDAIADYALKLNSDVNFENFRWQRSLIKRRNKPVRGRVVVSDMVVGSPLENYAGLLSYIIAFYDLINLDEASLADIDFFKFKGKQ